MNHSRAPRHHRRRHAAHHHVEPELDLGAVEQALERLDFSPDLGQDGWRWRGLIDGVPVRIEFLCDLADHREGESIRPTGCRKLSAANLRGTGYVARDFTSEQLHGRLADGTHVEVRARFAGLEGYLLSKCIAVRTRAAIKDYDDLAFVLQHNRAGGPEQAAHKLHDETSRTPSQRYEARSSRSASATASHRTPAHTRTPNRRCKSIPPQTRQSYAPTQSMLSSASSMP